MLCTFGKFWNQYYFVGPALWEVRSAGLLLYSFQSQSYSRGMISRARQWPSKAHAFIVQCFSFRKNIVSVNPRGVAAWYHHCFIGLTVTRKIVDVEVRLYVYDGQVLSEDYELRDTSGNFFQFYCVPLQQEKARILHNVPREHHTSFL